MEIFLNLFLAVLDLLCFLCGLSLVAAAAIGDYSLHSLLNAMASLIAEHRL